MSVTFVTSFRLTLLRYICSILRNVEIIYNTHIIYGTWMLYKVINCARKILFLGMKAEKKTIQNVD